MTRVLPEQMNCDPATYSTKNGFFYSLANKIMRYMIRRLDRRESTADMTIETVIGNGHVRDGISVSVPVYQQSSTRRLAFGETTSLDETNKPINDFYNNSTLTNIAKLFCALVLLIAFVLVMSRSFNFNESKGKNATDAFFF